MTLSKDPILNIKVLDPRELKANDYNPNIVLNQELKLLKLSILESGWIQPIIIGSDNVIIDGFHRYWLSMNDKEIIRKYKYQVPCVVLSCSEAERMMLTIRINRAKGSHMAFKMAENIKKIKDLGISEEELAEKIGATKQEIKLLSGENVFKKFDTTKKHSRAWVSK